MQEICFDLIKLTSSRLKNRINSLETGTQQLSLNLSGFVITAPIMPSLTRTVTNLPDDASVNFQGSLLYGLDLIDCPKANFKNARLVCVNANNLNLASSDFTGANVRCSDFMGSDLSGSNLTWAKFQDVNLSRANLQDVCFTEAEISFCSWEGAQVDYEKMYREIGGKTPLDRVILHGGIQEYMGFLK